MLIILIKQLKYKNDIKDFEMYVFKMITNINNII